MLCDPGLDPASSRHPRLQVLLHLIAPAVSGTSNGPSSNQSPQIRSFHGSILSHSLYMSEPAKSSCFNFSYDVGLGHKFFQLDVRPHSPAAILSLKTKHKMADSDRIIFPDEVEDAKAAAAESEDKNQGGDSNSLDEVPVVVPEIQSRNMIIAPPNCPPGYEMGSDGVCRQIFK
ncbi:hypothetical protein evm_010760 [Chilo suppressalis]|nr:hypothetical protein evm_010760 [Chilo suppressalis]